jgi:hypothetical protein
VGIAAFQRVYGAAWQHRAPGGNWQIMFSRLGRDGSPSVVAGQFDVPVAAGVTHHHTDPQLVWHTDGYGLGWRQQPVAGGPHQLFFQVLDENGRSPDLAVAPPVAPAPPFAVSGAAADVEQFQLVWNAGASGSPGSRSRAGRPATGSARSQCLGGPAAPATTRPSSNPARR